MGEGNAQLLGLYYRRIFPFKPYYKWLCYGKKPSDYFSRRELAFILEGDVHLRYRSFTDQSEFEKELCRMSPEKLDVGAVYNYRPSERQRHSDFRATERELVFDIDLTDYDDVRTCCSDARVCTKCWRFVALAVKVLDHLIENEFGFMSRMWVFSGRRGVHCWVADEKARKLSAGGRTAIAEHLSLVQGTKIEPGKSKRNRVFVHPVFDTAYQTMINSPEFEKLVVEQGWLIDERLPKVLLLHSDESLRDEIFEKMKQLPADSAARLKLLRRYFDPEARKEYKANQLPRYDSTNPDTTAFMKKFVLYYAYPRLDVNVSTGLNHLLKSPFCVHPKTGCVAVPLEVETVEKFNPLEAPTIGKLNAEIVNLVNDETTENRKLCDYRHTALAPYLATFEKFVENIAK